jgi:hypothetical protein
MNDHDVHELDLHEECKNQFRSSIILQHIDKYPQSLAELDSQKSLLLHRLLRNEMHSVELAMAMISKYPAALQHQDQYGFLPIHLYCKSAILSKCIELYPESLRVADLQGYLPLHIRLKRYTSSVDDA